MSPHRSANPRKRSGACAGARSRACSSPSVRSIVRPMARVMSEGLLARGDARDLVERPRRPPIAARRSGWPRPATRRRPRRAAAGRPGTDPATAPPVCRPRLSCPCRRSSPSVSHVSRGSSASRRATRKPLSIAAVANPDRAGASSPPAIRTQSTAVAGIPAMNTGRTRIRRAVSPRGDSKSRARPAPGRRAQ